MEKFFGSLITAMVTPFDENYDVNYNKLVELAQYLLERGSDTLLVTGTTGESPTLSKEEKVDIYNSLVESVGGKVKIIAGTGSNSTRETVNLSKKAELAGVDGIMLVVPYYNKPPQEGLYEHFKSVAEEVSVPVMLYNIPGRTGVNMSAETSIRLSEIENIKAIKEASGNITQITTICSSTKEDFAVYSGDDFMTLPVLSLGGDGVVSTSSHLVGSELRKMIDSYKNGKVKEAAELHQKLMPLFSALFMSTNPIPLKAALNICGMNVGPPRLPLTPLNEEMASQLKQLLQNYELTGV